ncbi:MAG: hypothetical protein M0Z77_11540 [Thermoplasmatales archaeon]|nr:hypothetical protein [Candidatus Thermoplasmatota archaeon]MCL6002901.1 hypothetical protein [Candidatus Thermoplasmatota archaeon]MDA8056261.1 hypothetical protein [Thermoplasmatales archaeon]
MISEKTLYALIAVIVVVGGIGIGAAYYHEVSVVPSSSNQSLTTSLTMIISPNVWFNNSTGTQPAFFVVEPNGELASSALIQLPVHTKITLTIIDYDGALAANIGSNGTSNNSTYAKVIGTIGGLEYVYNGSSSYINATLSGNSSNNITIQHGVGWAVSSLPWVGGAAGGWEVSHTFTITQNGQILLNVPSFGGTNPSGGTVTVTQFYLNSTGSFTWQCFVPCGSSASGWNGAMSTPGWMTGTVQVIS